MSKRSSLIKLELELEPLIYTKNEIPKSINKLTGIVSIKIASKNKAPNIQIKIDVLVMITIIELIKKELITTKKRIAKKKKSSTGPTSFSLSFKMNNLTKLFINVSCLI